MNRYKSITTYYFTKRLVPSSDTFRVRGDKPLVWLQRVCAAVLHRMGAVDETTQLDKVVIDTHRFMDRVLKQRDVAYELTGRAPTRLIIGSEQYSNLMSEPDHSHYFTFEAEYNNITNGKTQLLGMTVEVVPWMSGILVLP